MSGIDTAIDELVEKHSTPGMFAAPRSAALPYLTVADASRALAWYTDALGAVLIGEPIVMDDNRIGHAELGIGGGVFYLARACGSTWVSSDAPGSARDRAQMHGIRGVSAERHARSRTER